jgi:hypothetical protein
MSAVILQIGKAEVRFGEAPPSGPIVPQTLTDFSCQVTRAEITSQSNTTTTSVPATFCQPASEASVPVASTFQLNLDFLQDWTQANGLSAWLFKNDATEQAFALYLQGAADPVATGTIIAQAGAFGGTPGQTLTASVTLNIQGYPDIKDATGASIRPEGGAVAITGVTEGTPATLQPTGAVAPANLAALKAHPVIGDAGTSAPTAAWTGGTYILLGDSSQAHWDGSAWLVGAST